MQRLLRTALIPFVLFVIQVPAVFAQLDPPLVAPSAPNFIGSGARALGISSFVAIVDDATAASWNPAGLIHLERPEASVVGAYMRKAEDFSSRIDPDIDRDNHVDSADLNFLSISYPFHVFNRNFVVSANYHQRLSFDRELGYSTKEDTGTIKATEQYKTSLQGVFGAVSVALAAQILSNLYLGAAANIWTDGIYPNEYTLTTEGNGIGTVIGHPVSLRYYSKERFKKFFGLNANFGVLWRPKEWVSFGANFELPFMGNITRDTWASSSIVRTDTGAEISGGDIFTAVDGELEIPMHYALGVALRITDRLTIGLDVGRIHWEDYILDLENEEPFSPITGLPKDESDVDPITYFRLGTEYLIIREKVVVPIRFGLFTDPQPGQHGSEDLVGFSLGTGLVWSPVAFDVAYQFRYGGNTGRQVFSTEDARATLKQHYVMASVIFQFK